MGTIVKNIWGIMVVLIIALVSNLLGIMVPVVGGAVIAIVLGMILNQSIQKPTKWQPGIQWMSKKGLQLAIILLGTGYSFHQVINVGKDSLILLLFVFLTALLSTLFFGKLLKVSNHLQILLGVGTAICGGTAIAATAPILNADEKDISYAISTIFLFNILAVLLYPVIGHLFNMSSTFFGQWAGLSINDTSSVVAASYAYSDASGRIATIVKLARTMMILPVTGFLAIYMSSKQKNSSSSSSSYSLKTIFPWFILLFFIAVLLNSIGFLSLQVTLTLSSIGKFLIIMALAAIGLNTNLERMVKTGLKPMILGGLVWISVVIVSLITLTFLQ